MSGLLNEAWTMLIGVNSLFGVMYLALVCGPNGVSKGIRYYSAKVESGKSSTSESTGALPIPKI